MSGAVEVLGELQRRGVTFTADGKTLCLRPRRALDDALLARIREAKPAILEALRNRPATCGASCYEAEPGRWIHRPWDGCATPYEKKPLRAVRETCWHCHGEKRCDCITCWQAGPSECVACKGSGQVARWIQ